MTDPAALLEEHGDYLYRFALSRLRNEDVAQDVVQETLLAALKSRPNFDARSSERTWLIGIMKHKIADHYRKTSRETPMSDLESPDEAVDGRFNFVGHWRGSPAEWSAAPDTLVQEKDFHRTLRGCLDKLPGKLADVFTLRDMEEMPSEEICEKLGITPTNLYASLHRARFRLRECLEYNWFGKTAGKGSSR
ncbi:MAG: sigma-70 family RNA polymerase sigma factor [Candidatus Sumerlaeaceae bacterium]|nr:sigma-70 family RNA polymerase sigma factor [Candidatus Sumerlaeaceae bacterium]